MQTFIVAAVVVLVCCVMEQPVTALQHSSTYTTSRDWVQLFKDYYNTYTKNNNIDAPHPAFDAERDVIFRLYTTHTLKNPDIIAINNLMSVKKSFWNPSDPTRIIIQGMAADCNAPINILLREAYLAVGEFNVVTVDWGKGGNWFKETSNQLLLNSKSASAVVAKFIDWLNIIGYLEFNQVSVIGHSIGAHMGGMTGKLVTRGRIHTIVGLEPGVGPNKNAGPDERLEATDAEYVEVIHTNAGDLGVAFPIGTADFYVNGGTVQPGCEMESFMGCNHNIVLAYMAESINPIDKKFASIQCGSYDEILNNSCTSTGTMMVNMGENLSNHDLARGIYYLTTNIVSPYARG